MLGGSWKRRRRKDYSKMDERTSSLALHASGGVGRLNISRGIRHKASQPLRIYGPQIVRGSGTVLCDSNLVSQRLTMGHY